MGQTIIVEFINGKTISIVCQDTIDAWEVCDLTKYNWEVEKIYVLI